MKYLMHIKTGSVDTLDNWLADEKANYGTDDAFNINELLNNGSLVEVTKDADGNWVEVQ